MGSRWHVCVGCAHAAGDEVMVAVVVDCDDLAGGCG